MQRDRQPQKKVARLIQPPHSPGPPVERTNDQYRYEFRFPRSEDLKSEVVRCTHIDGIRVIEIRSKYLDNAITKVNKHPPLQPANDFFSEQEPYPTLFHHMDDIKSEIAQMDDKVAHEDLEILQMEIAYIEPIWNEARQESNDMVSYGMIWKFFHPGDLVLREDDLGNWWLFVLVKFAYGYTTKQIERGGQAREKEASFEAWYLAWDESDGSLIKKHVQFICPDFSGKLRITSLPLYPIRYKEDMIRRDIKGAFAKRGRRWQEFITTKSICQHHCGLAFMYNRLSKDVLFQVSRSVLIHPAIQSFASEVEGADKY